MIMRHSFGVACLPIEAFGKIEFIVAAVVLELASSCCVTVVLGLGEGFIVIICPFCPRDLRAEIDPKEPVPVAEGHTLALLGEGSGYLFVFFELEFRMLTAS